MNIKKWLGTSLILLLLIGCGGGGSDSTDSTSRSLYGFWNYKAYYQECSSTPAEGIAAFEDTPGHVLIISGEDWHNDCSTSSLDEAISLPLINDFNAVSESNFKEALLDALAPAYEGELEIAIEEYSENEIVFKLLDGRDSSVEIVELYKTDDSDQPESIDITGTWDYTLSYSTCPDETELGTFTWTYYSDGYGLSYYTDNELNSDTCEYEGSRYYYDDMSLTANPVSAAELQNALYEIGDAYWTVVFESENRITFTASDGYMTGTFILTR